LEHRQALLLGWDMIVYTKQGERIDLRHNYAYDGAVFTIRLNGTRTYTDPADSSVWTWEDVTNDVDEVLGVNQEGDVLFVVESVPDCKALPGSWYWDDADGVLYIHWNESTRYPKGNPGNISVIVSGYSSGYSNTTKNVFDDVYYDPIITSLQGLSKKVDPVKLGLLSFKRSSIGLADEINQFRQAPAGSAVGVPVWVFYNDEDETELKTSNRIFTGVLDGYIHNGSNVQQKIIESRLFENKPICPNIATTDEYPNIGSNKDKFKPTAWGKIRRGKMLLTNQDSLTSSSSGTAEFLLADPSLDSIRAVTAVYDKEDNDVGSLTIDLVNCTVSATKPAGVAVSDLKDWSWEGEAYDIDGDYNNGLDIMKDAFLKLAGVPFLESTYNVDEWNEQTAVNPESLGFSFQTDKGFIEELIEPIQTSLQGNIDIQGTGKITFISRDTSAAIKRFVTQNKEISDPNINVVSDSTVSELLIEYSRNYVTKDPFNFLYRGDKVSVITDYGINRREPLSPVKTGLTEEADAETLALEIMDTSKQPERIIETDPVDIDKNIRIWDIVAIDTGKYGEENIEIGEVLGVAPDYLNNREKYTVRIIPDREYIEGSFWNGDYWENAFWASADSVSTEWAVVDEAVVGENYVGE